MTEIKFRAWDKDGEHYHEETHRLMIRLDGKIYNSEYGDLQCERFVIQQYIGRKDKNGAEIYEGDILKDGNCIFVVPSIDELIDMAFEENSFASFDDCEIIGNELENPELLKD